jgi:hypothetical protein
MTVDNMTGFSQMFSSQADALNAEQRRTEDLLAEMLPRSVAKQLRAGCIPEAELYEVEFFCQSFLVFGRHTSLYFNFSSRDFCNARAFLRVFRVVSSPLLR